MKRSGGRLEPFNSSQYLRQSPFARGQQESRGRLENQERAPDPRFQRRFEPEETGSFPQANGQIY